MKRKESPKEPRNYLLIAKWTLGIGIACIIISPIIFTCHTASERWNFINTGPIGDTIGGLTAPIIGLISAILLFLALRAQLDGNKAANTALITQLESDDLTHLYSNIKQSIDQFTYTPKTYTSNDSHDDTNAPKNSTNELKAAEAIYALIDNFYCDMCALDDRAIGANPKLTELISILELLKFTLDRIEQSTIPNKEAILTLTKHQFKYRINPRLSLEDDALDKYFCPSCNKEHGLPDDVAKLVRELQNRTSI
ncbi:hypothetical protein [Chitinophaga sp. sic0106]|uniref:hypothetical protein n=1 Tax=Chitinophaga sp. sic0106 TaxID=2854785 RepID=UPI001C4694A9|nr:hypothetical protein [Chitinophaga sp. sic0106]MBV7533052.1 hypothetical protein [Chitinophaga sp. sic0106]